MEPDMADEVERFATRIKRAWSGPAYRKLREEIRAQPDGGVALLRALANHRSQVIRVWAGGVARLDLGADAIPLLQEMAQNRSTETRDAAMQDLEAIDPELLRPFVRDMRRIFGRSKTLYSPGGAAMWRLAKLRDPESAALFRRYAAKRNPAWYDHRMPMVLADYIDDSMSVARRLREHDHAWTLWLATAARLLNVHGAEDALRVGSERSPDPDCREVCAKELDGLLRFRQASQPQGHDGT
jgi:hypothetical protein